MALILDSTVGGANANSFVTVARAVEIHEGRYHNSDFFALTVDTQEVLLVQATTILDRQQWAGRKATSAQRLSWPRAYVPDPDSPSDASTIYLDDSTIPRFLEEATAELAFVLLPEDRLLESDSAGMKSIKVGSVALDFDRMDRPGILTPYVRRLIAPYLRAGGTMLLRA